MSDALLAAFGICAEEVHPELDAALAFAREIGVRQVEILAFDGKPVVEHGAAALREARRRLDAAGLTCSGVGSLCLKPTLLGGIAAGQVTRDPAFRAEMEVLRASISAAEILGAPIVRTFGFRRDGMVDMGNPGPRLPRGGEIPAPILEKIAEGLRHAAALASAAGLVLGLENVRSCWANTGHNAAAVIAATGHPALRAIWDPGNDYVSGGVPYPDGYTALRPHICHLHVKDARVVDAASGLTAWEAVGRGELDYTAQFAALRRDGYTGTLSLETHWRLPAGREPHRVEASRLSFEGIRAALDASLGGAP